MAASLGSALSFTLRKAEAVSLHAIRSQPGCLFQILPALLKNLGMGIDSFQILDWRIRLPHQIMFDPQGQLADYLEVIFEQQVIVFMDAARKAVFDGNDAESRLFAVHQIEDFPE